MRQTSIMAEHDVLTNDPREETPPPSERLTELRKQLLAAREEHDALCQEIKAGKAESWVYEALKVAFAVADEDDPDDQTRQFAMLSIADQLGAARAGKEIDGNAIGESIGRSIRDVKEIQRGGGALHWLRRDRSPLQRISANLSAARLPSSMPVGVQAPGVEKSVAAIAEWRRVSEERSNRQTAALEGMLSVLESQVKGGRVVLIATVVAAVSSTVAAIVGIISLVH